MKRAKSMLQQWKACLVSHQLYRLMVVCSLRTVHYRKVSALRNQVARAEVFQAFHVVTANHSFSSTNEDSERFKPMFLDSKIAARYSQHVDKTRYAVVSSMKPQHRRSKNKIMNMLRISVKNINKSLLAIADHSLSVIETAKL